MLGGNMPFWNRRQYKMVRMIINGNYHFDHQIWDQISAEAKDLIRGLLDINSMRRLTVDQVKKCCQMKHEVSNFWNVLFLITSMA
jgi:hypothetical protein